MTTATTSSPASSKSMFGFTIPGYYSAELKRCVCVVMNVIFLINNKVTHMELEKQKGD